MDMIMAMTRDELEQKLYDFICNAAEDVPEIMSMIDAYAYDCCMRVQSHDEFPQVTR